MRVLSEKACVIDGYPAIVLRKNIRNIYLRVKSDDRFSSGTALPNAALPGDHISGAHIPSIHIEVTAPRAASGEKLAAFVHAHRRWIDKTMATLAAAQQSGQSIPQKWTDERKREAAAKIRRRLEVLLPRWTAVVGREPTSISLRAMKTRWGSCTPATGRIRLNLELADMPDRFLEYVLVHELTHLRAAGHGPLFQRCMDDYLPQWRTLRHDINRYVIA